jgi:hypothetical protein
MAKVQDINGIEVERLFTAGVISKDEARTMLGLNNDAVADLLFETLRRGDEGGATYWRQGIVNALAELDVAA